MFGHSNSGTQIEMKQMNFRTIETEHLPTELLKNLDHL